jgi:hypothetical protein
MSSRLARAQLATGSQASSSHGAASAELAEKASCPMYAGALRSGLEASSGRAPIRL